MLQERLRAQAGEARRALTSVSSLDQLIKEERSRKLLLPLQHLSSMEMKTSQSFKGKGSEAEMREAEMRGVYVQRLIIFPCSTRVPFLTL